MPLDARKTQHLLQVITRSFAGRQRSVVVVYLAGGSYSYTPAQVIMRPQQAVNPQIFNASGQPLPRSTDTVIIAPLSLSFTGAVYVADTSIATASAVAAAAKYEIVEILPIGIIPGGSHQRIALRRLR